VVVLFYETRWSTSAGAIFQKLQGSVATHFGCDGKFDDSFVANFLRESISGRILKICHCLAKI